MRKRFKGYYTYQKDIGKLRVTNEDESLVVCNAYGDVMMVVADGMGGALKGDYASKTAVAYLRDAFETEGEFRSRLHVCYFIKKTLSEINKELYIKSITDLEYRGMGTTIVVAFIYKNKLIVANAGDSRAYILQEGELYQLTEDHSYVNYLYKKGEIRFDEIQTHPKRHMLTNAVGLFENFQFDLQTYLYSGETILLCSDGLYNNVSLKDITNELKTKFSVEQKVSSLINLANFNGGTDNVSLALWETIDD